MCFVENKHHWSWWRSFSKQQNKKIRLLAKISCIGNRHCCSLSLNWSFSEAKSMMLMLMLPCLTEKVALKNVERDTLNQMCKRNLAGKCNFKKTTCIIQTLLLRSKLSRRTFSYSNKPKRIWQIQNSNSNFILHHTPLG